MKTKKALLVCLALAGTATAGEIAGRVYDPSGGVVPNASVTLFSLGDGGTHKSTTDAQGEFAFSGFAGGRYRVEVAVPGFALAREGGLLPGVADSLRLDIVLRLGGVRESMTIHRSGTPGPAVPRRMRVGGRVQPPKMLAQLRPVYPEASNSAGRVLLHAVILPDGSVGRAQVIAAPDEALADAVMQAVLQWRYQPALLNGQPVETETMIQIDYRMAP